MTHHAVLFCSHAPLTCLLEEYTFVPAGSQLRQAQFGIDDVRKLISDAYRRPDGETTMRTMLIATEFITEEAQQALLKIIEEPPLSTQFVFIIPHGYTLLPTLESRFERRAGEHGLAHDISAFREFKNAPIGDRFALIEQAIKNKNHAWQQEIKNGLTAYLLGHKREVSLPILKELEFVVRLLLTRGASNKFLLEHLALTLPA